LVKDVFYDALFGFGSELENFEIFLKKSEIYLKNGQKFVEARRGY
jgi:hypothetical protein